MLAQCWEYCSNFLSSAALKAKPDFLTAFEIILGCSGEVMVITRAAGCPADQQGKYTSRGREFVSGIRFSARKLVTGWQRCKWKNYVP